MYAKFAGQCRDCKKPVPKGALISCAYCSGQAIDPAKPVGPCWECKDPRGFFRNLGAATPVRCDACHAKFSVNDFNRRDHSSHEDRACGDTAYEDACAQACGL